MKHAKQFCLIIVLLIANTAYAKLALTPLGAEKLSNVFNLAESADKQFAASNYVASLTMYINAEDELGRLMELAQVNPIKCRKYLLELNEKKETCEPLAARQTYFRLIDEYSVDKTNFLNSLPGKNISTLNILFDKAVKTYEQLSKLYLIDSMPKELPRVSPPTDLQRLYRDCLFSFRTNWIKNLKLTPDQLFTFNQIAYATSLTYHVYWLDNAVKNERTTITLSWLQNIYQNLVEQEPCNYGFWYGLGNSYILQNKTHQANVTWHRALKYFPDSLYFHYHLAKTCGINKNESMRAVSHLRWILTKTQNRLWRAKTHYQLAIRYDELGDLDAAYKEAVSAEELAAMDIVILNDLFSKAKKTQGQILLKLNKNDEAVSALKSAADASPDNISLKLDVADLLTSLANSPNKFEQKYADEALRWYDRALRQDPEIPAAHGSKAYIYLLMGKTVSAQGEAIMELAIKPDSPVSLATLGYTYLAQENYESAKHMFKKALDFDPECSAAIDGLTKAEGKLKESKPHFPVRHNAE